MEREEKFGAAHIVLLVLTAAFLASLAWLTLHGAEVEAAEGWDMTVEHSVPAEELVPVWEPLNVNTAAAEELERLPGIGPVLAQAIVDYRTEHGPFESVDELLRVDGIGKTKLENIRNEITVGEENTP